MPNSVTLDVKELLRDIRRADRRATARAINLCEAGGAVAEQLLDALAPSVGRAWRIGVTGPPGAGKSTLTAQLVKRFRSDGQRVAVVAVDPSSPFSRGALLGDRVRMAGIGDDDGVYIRSMAARGALGGLSATASDAGDVLDAAGYDVVFFETVGVGQNELDVVKASDATIVVITPESGDEVQAAKAGLMEIGDLFVLNKSERPGSETAAAGLQNMLRVAAQELLSDTWRPRLLRTTAADGTGVNAVRSAILEHRSHSTDSGACARRRSSQALDRVGVRLRNMLGARYQALRGTEAFQREFAQVQESCRGTREWTRQLLDRLCSTSTESHDQSSKEDQ